MSEVLRVGGLTMLEAIKELAATEITVKQLGGLERALAGKVSRTRSTAWEYLRRDGKITPNDPEEDWFTRGRMPKTNFKPGDYSILDHDFKIFLWLDLIRATGRYIPKPSIDISFPEYVRKIISSPVSPLCIDFGTQPEVGESVVVFDRIKIHDNAKGFNPDVPVGILSHVHYYREDDWIYYITLATGGSISIDSQLENCAMPSYLHGKPESFARLISNQANSGIPEIGDIVRVKTDRGVIPVHKKKYCGDRLLYKQEIDLKRDYYVLGKENKQLYLVPVGESSGRMTSNCQIFIVPIENVKKKKQKKLPERGTSHDIRYQTQEELREIVYATVLNFFREEGLCGEGMASRYENWRHALIHDQKTGYDYSESKPDDNHLAPSNTPITDDDETEEDGNEYDQDNGVNKDDKTDAGTADSGTIRYLCNSVIDTKRSPHPHKKPSYRSLTYDQVTYILEDIAKIGRELEARELEHAGSN